MISKESIKVIIELLEDEIKILSEVARSDYHNFRYYCNRHSHKILRKSLNDCLKVRSKYKRALKEMKKLQTKSEINPCPICGSEVKLKGGSDDWAPTFNDPDGANMEPIVIVCDKCKFEIRTCYFENSDAIAVWNRAATTFKKIKEIDDDDND